MRLALFGFSFDELTLIAGCISQTANRDATWSWRTSHGQRLVDGRGRARTPAHARIREENTRPPRRSGHAEKWGESAEKWPNRHWSSFLDAVLYKFANRNDDVWKMAQNKILFGKTLRHSLSGLEKVLLIAGRCALSLQFGWRHLRMRLVVLGLVSAFTARLGQEGRAAAFVTESAGGTGSRDHWLSAWTAGDRGREQTTPTQRGQSERRCRTVKVRSLPASYPLLQ